MIRLEYAMLSEKTMVPEDLKTMYTRYVHPQPSFVYRVHFILYTCTLYTEQYLQ